MVRLFPGTIRRTDENPEGLDAVLVAVDGATYLPTRYIFAARYNVNFRNHGQSHLLEHGMTQNWSTPF